MPAKIKTINAKDVIYRYVSLLNSENCIAKYFGVSRNVIARILKENCVNRRTQSESEYVKWSQMDFNKRAAQVLKAHDSVRGVKRTYSELYARAKTRQQTLQYDGFGEIDVHKLLDGSIHQQAFHQYNIDIGYHPVAVEIHNTCTYPINDQRIKKRFEYLLSCGWWVIFVKVCKSGKTSIKPRPVANEINRFRDFAIRNPSCPCQYRVIGGEGNYLSGFRF